MNNSVKLLYLMEKCGMNIKCFKKQYMQDLKKDPVVRKAKLYINKKVKDENLKTFRKDIKKFKLKRKSDLSMNLITYKKYNEIVNLYSKYMEVNPYYYDNNKAIIPLECIEEIYVDEPEYGGRRSLQEILDDENIKKRTKKKLVLKIIDEWNMSYRTEMNDNINRMTEKIELNVPKNLKVTGKIEQRFFFFVSIILMLSYGAANMLSWMPIAGDYIERINDIMADQFLGILAMLLIYLGVFIGVLLMVYNTYIKETKNFSKSSNKYLSNIQKELNRSMKGESKYLRRFFGKKSKRRSFKRKYTLDNLTRVEKNINAIDSYTTHIGSRVSFYKKYNRKIKLFKIVLEVSFLVIFLVLAYNLYNYWNIL